MRNNKKIAALILAAGNSSRAPGFKPLLPLGSGTVIDASIHSFLSAGINDVVVVTGHRAAELAPALNRLRVRSVHNERHQDGMFSSVVTGVRSLHPGTDAFFLLPADMPLVRSHTIRALSKAYARTAADVIYPVFQGRRGHPPLISARCGPAILSWDQPEGLRSLLRRYEQTTKDVEVMDEGILIDLDTAPDYQRVACLFAKRELPSQRERDAILAAVKTPHSVVRHCQAVSATGRTLAEALNRAGQQLDVELISTGGMLHDLAKGRPHHAMTGARMLLTTGYPVLAQIVARHHTIFFQEGMPLTEAAILFLADKIVLGNTVVSLGERFRECLGKYVEDPTVLNEIKLRLQSARNIKKAVEQQTGKRLDEIVPVTNCAPHVHAEECSERQKGVRNDTLHKAHDIKNPEEFQNP
jgi:molybdenum cofactor cytidylyltransferase